MKRAYFAIQNCAGAPNRIDAVLGWTDGEYGYHKLRYNKWAATDIVSGTRIYVASTRKECAEWCEGNKDKIEARREEPSYVSMVVKFKELIEKELDNFGV